MTVPLYRHPASDLRLFTSPPGKGRARLALAANLLVLTPAWVVPWYGSWPVALAAIEDDATAQMLAIITTAYLLTDALPLPF